jgi:hypothetical protein
VCLQGYRVVHESHARAFDRLPEKPAEEFQRKVRTLAGCFQLASLVPEALLPRRNPIWLQFVSHKMLRLVMPWAIIGAYVASAFLPGEWYRYTFWCQEIGFFLAMIGLFPGVKNLRPASAAASFFVLNTAACVAFWVWISGRAERSWGKIEYEEKSGMQKTKSEITNPKSEMNIVHSSS